MLNLILDIYRVEHAAFNKGIARTQKHAELRKTDGKKAVEKLHGWLKENEPIYPQSSPIGAAIAHALKNWDRLTLFVDDVQIPVDNNASERFLRPIAKGRDNWLFAGNDKAAENIAALMTLTSTCEANNINPEAYLTDILPRLADHPLREIDALRAANWKPVPAD